MIISFITEQGGVGKTSLCFNLGWYLASQGKKVLMIDMDAQGGNLSFASGVTNLEERKGIYDILAENEDINNCICRLSPNLHIIPANDNAIHITKVVDMLGGIKALNCLSKKIDMIKTDYDYIFIDTNPTPSSIHLISLTASDYLIIPLVPDGKSIEGTKHIIDTFKAIKKTNNANLDIMALVFNKYEKRTTLSKAVEKTMIDMCRNEGFPIAQTKITNNVAIAETMLAKEGITTYNPKSKGAVNYAELAKELFGI